MSLAEVIVTVKPEDIKVVIEEPPDTALVVDPSPGIIVIGGSNLGPTGAPGPRGLTGSEGPVGSQGLEGPMGPTGPQGVQGPEGTPGTAVGSAHYEWKVNTDPSDPSHGFIKANNADATLYTEFYASVYTKENTVVRFDQVEVGGLFLIYELGQLDTWNRYEVTGPIINHSNEWFTVPCVFVESGPLPFTPGGNTQVEVQTPVKGDPGPMGPQGPIGATGPQGAQGVQGATGSQGVKGDTGATGSQGIQGVQGDIGPVGSQGVKGDTGAASTVPGPSGPQGVQGPTGPPGADSTVPGPQGIKGDKGDKGDTGTTGAASTVPGPPGVKGDPGNTGPAGPTGAASTVPGPPGEDGLGAPIAWEFIFDDVPADGTDPGSGLLRMDNSTNVFSTSLLNFDNLDADGIDRTNEYAIFQAQGLPLPVILGTFRIAKVSDPSVFMAGTIRTIADITGAQETLVLVYACSSDAPFADGDRVAFSFQLGGTDGQSGTGGGATDLEYLGEWQSGTEYSDGDVVLYNGVPYMATKTTMEAPVEWSVPGAGPIGPQGPEGSPGAQGVQGPAGVAGPWRMGQSWSILGPLVAATLPPIFIPKLAAQTCTLVGVRAKIASGTSIVAQMQRNGTNLGSPITIAAAAATTAFSQAFSDTDTLGVVLSAPTGSPNDLSLTAILEHQA